MQPYFILVRRSFILVFFSLVLSCDDPSSGQPRHEDETFTNPVLTSAPDPWVIQQGDFYYVTYTTGNNLKLIRTSEMSELSQGEVRTIWSPPAGGPGSKNIWAPELHFIQGKWYYYYAADDGQNENHRMWVLENSHPDPFQGTWTEKGEVALPDDKWAIDGTIAERNGELYFLWSGWDGDVNVQQNIYICKMANPWTAVGERIRLSQPDFAWEKSGGPPYVNEAPQWLTHDDEIFITYSASGCWTDEYSLGLMTTDVTADLLNPDSWNKSNEPIFTKNESSLAFGPGHNSFFKSKDGTEDWLTYHANDASGAGCGDDRSMRMQKFTWENGRPFFGTPVALGLSLSVPSGEDED